MAGYPWISSPCFPNSLREGEFWIQIYGEGRKINHLSPVQPTQSKVYIAKEAEINPDSQGGTTITKYKYKGRYIDP